MKEIEETLEQIQKSVGWYHNKNKSNSFGGATIDNLLKVKSQLVTLNYRLAELSANVKSEYNNSYYIRKIKVVQAKNLHISKGEAISKAESLATEEQAEHFQTEIEWEAMSYKLDLMLRQSNIVVRDIEQRISVLKIEIHNSKTT